MIPDATNRYLGWSIAPLVFLFLTSGCSYMRVTTELYRNPAIADEHRDVALVTSNLVELLDALPTTLPDTAASFYVKNVDQLNDDNELLLGTDLAEFAESYKNVLSEGVLGPLEPQRKSLRDHAERVRRCAALDDNSSQCPAALKRELGLLRIELAEYRNPLDSKLREAYEVNVEELGTAIVVASASKKQPVTQAEALKKVEPYTSPLKNTLNAISIEPMDEKKEQLRTLEHLPLTDPRVAEVVGAPDKQWEKYVNDVSATGAFGNSEFSIVMRSLGDYHLKGVVFDPSQVSQATLDTMAQTVNMLAKAYGVPVRAGASDPSSPQQPLSLPEIDGEFAAIEHADETRRARMGELFAKLIEAGAVITSDQEANKRKGELAKALRGTAAQLRSGK